MQRSRRTSSTSLPLVQRILGLTYSGNRNFSFELGFAIELPSGLRALRGSNLGRIAEVDQSRADSIRIKAVSRGQQDLGKEC